MHRTPPDAVLTQAKTAYEKGDGYIALRNMTLCIEGQKPQYFKRLGAKVVTDTFDPLLLFHNRLAAEQGDLKASAGVLNNYHYLFSANAPNSVITVFRNYVENVLGAIPPEADASTVTLPKTNLFEGHAAPLSSPPAAGASSAAPVASRVVFAFLALNMVLDILTGSHLGPLFTEVAQALFFLCERFARPRELEHIVDHILVTFAQQTDKLHSDVTRDTLIAARDDARPAALHETDSELPCKGPAAAAADSPQQNILLCQEDCRLIAACAARSITDYALALRVLGNSAQSFERLLRLAGLFARGAPDAELAKAGFRDSEAAVPFADADVRTLVARHLRIAGGILTDCGFELTAAVCKYKLLACDLATAPDDLRMLANETVLGLLTLPSSALPAHASAFIGDASAQVGAGVLEGRLPCEIVGSRTLSVTALTGAIALETVAGFRLRNIPGTSATLAHDAGCLGGAGDAGGADVLALPAALARCILDSDRLRAVIHPSVYAALPLVSPVAGPAFEQHMLQGQPELYTRDAVASLPDFDDNFVFGSRCLDLQRTLLANAVRALVVRVLLASPDLVLPLERVSAEVQPLFAGRRANPDLNSPDSLEDTLLSLLRARVIPGRYDMVREELVFTEDDRQQLQFARELAQLDAGFQQAVRAPVGPAPPDAPLKAPAAGRKSVDRGGRGGPEYTPAAFAALCASPGFAAGYARAYFGGAAASAARPVLCRAAALVLGANARLFDSLPLVKDRVVSARAATLETLAARARAAAEAEAQRVQALIAEHRERVQADRDVEQRAEEENERMRQRVAHERMVRHMVDDYIFNVATKLNDREMQAHLEAIDFSRFPHKEANIVVMEQYAAFEQERAQRRFRRHERMANILDFFVRLGRRQAAARLRRAEDAQHARTEQHLDAMHRARLAYEREQHQARLGLKHRMARLRDLDAFVAASTRLARAEHDARLARWLDAREGVRQRIAQKIAAGREERLALAERAKDAVHALFRRKRAEVASGLSRQAAQAAQSAQAGAQPSGSGAYVPPHLRR